MTVHIHSLVHCSSLMLAKGSLTGGALQDSANTRATEHMQGDLCGGSEEEEKVTVVFSQRCARFFNCISVLVLGNIHHGGLVSQFLTCMYVSVNNSPCMNINFCDRFRVKGGTLHKRLYFHPRPWSRS